MRTFSHVCSVKASRAKVHPSARARFSRIIPTLLEWYEKNQRSFIWRGLRRSPYVVLVSEYMLQQTGAKHVEKKLPEFLKLFPNMKALAAAPRADVLRAWQGLGYNRRAINLHEAAKKLATIRRFPNTLEELQSLPGVGLYTASAVLAFSKNEDTAVVDVNIQRVLSRLAKPMEHVHDKLSTPDVYELDTAILPHGKSSMWHEALMDLGSTICTKNIPKCEICPLRSLCPSARSMKREIVRTASGEKKYFGQPRRIWRGRTLAEIMREQKASERKIVGALADKFEIAEGEFADFISSIVKQLIAEGFVRREKGKLCLA